MRRPVKPFVTEYRGGARRQAGGGQASKPGLFGNEPEAPAAEQRPLAPWPTDPQEDTYEAALRAADALFSARKQPEATPVPASAVRQATGEPREATVEPIEPTDEAHAPARRVLRDLSEPPPSEEMLRLEAERAPKRRGRKPGSKNKPKPVLPLAARDDREAFAAAFDAPAVSVVTAPTVVRAPRVAVLPQVARGPAVAAAPPGDKYAWVRTKLKPGQQWKRRLPKVAW